VLRTLCAECQLARSICLRQWKAEQAPSAALEMPGSAVSPPQHQRKGVSLRAGVAAVLAWEPPRNAHRLRVTVSCPANPNQRAPAGARSRPVWQRATCAFASVPVPRPISGLGPACSSWKRQLSIWPQDSALRERGVPVASGCAGSAAINMYTGYRPQTCGHL
jgi:hypothetical protein